MTVNTGYLNTAGSPGGVSNFSQIAGSQVSLVNVALSALTATGAVAASGTLTSTGTINAQSAKFLSRQTTASLTSATLADGEFAVGALSATSIILYFRSGVTTYRILANSAAVL